MDFKELAQKYIDYGITWLIGEFDDYKGMTTIITTDEYLNDEQLELLCNEIKKDVRVKGVIVENETTCTITIIFNR